MGRYTPEQTHKIMSSVHSKDTNIEIKLRKALWAKGYHYRKNVKKLPGKPDIAFIGHKVAIFCDAEFWHGKDWDTLKAKLQNGTNADFWVSKIERNRQRDIENNKKFEEMGWTVLRFWSNDILHDVDACVDKIEKALLNSQNKLLAKKYYT